MSDMQRWRGKVAIVTGASSGIGAATAERLAKAGMQVVGLARRVERVETLVEKLALEDCEGSLHAIKCDVRVEDEVKKAFEWTNDNLGPVHVLINNAGVVSSTNLIEGDTEKWRAILETNLLGLCMATREAVTCMIANDVKGHIVHLNSVLGHAHLYWSTASVYGATKHGVTNLTEMLRKELQQRQKSDIKVTSISPGMVDTEIFQQVGLRKELEIAPMLKPDDIADAILYVLGVPHSVHINEMVVSPTNSII